LVLGGSNDFHGSSVSVAVGESTLPKLLVARTQ
jgi:hypothetical protein